MSTYFNVVNLDKQEQASLTIFKTQKEVDETIAKWEEKNSEKWNRQRDPEGYEKQADGEWTRVIHKYYQRHMKMVFGFIFWEACADQWGHVSSWFGDRVIVISDGHGSKDLYEQQDWYEINETYKQVTFEVSYDEWRDAHN